jgi:hypothetical protein
MDGSSASVLGAKGEGDMIIQSPARFVNVAG